MKQDVVAKEYWEDKERFADLFNAAFFQGNSMISADHLTHCPTEMLSEFSSRSKVASETFFRDSLMSYTYDGINLAILGLENQKHIHYAMPLRTYFYDCLSYQRQYRELRRQHRKDGDLCQKEFLSGIKKDERLIPVVTIIIYYGEERWDAAKSLHDMLTIPPAWKSFVNNYTMHLIEVRNQNLIFHQKDNQDLFSLFRILYEQNKIKERMETAVQYTATHSVAPQVLSLIASSSQFPTVAKQTLKKGENSMCQVFDEIYQEGKNAGLTEGSVRQLIRIYKKLNTPVQIILEEMEKELHLSHEQALQLYKKHNSTPSPLI